MISLSSANDSTFHPQTLNSNSLRTERLRQHFISTNALFGDAIGQPGSIGGLSLGLLTPLLVIFFNAVFWGIPAATLYDFISASSSPYGRSVACIYLLLILALATHY